MIVQAAIENKQDYEISIWLEINAYREMLNLCIEKYPLETGGVLMGYWANKNEVFITSVIGPGDKAIHAGSRFIPDQHFHEVQISNYFYASNGRDNYLGDWHTHPNAESYLSAKDKTTLIKIRRNKESNLDTALMLILGTSPLHLNCWTCTLNRKETKIQLQPAIRLFQESL